MAIGSNWWALPHEERQRIIREQLGMSNRHPTAAGDSWRWLIRRVWGTCWRPWLWSAGSQRYGKVIRVRSWNTAVIDWGHTRTTITPDPLYRPRAVLVNLSPIYAPLLCLFTNVACFFACASAVQNHNYVLASVFALQALASVFVYNETTERDWVAYMRSLS